MKNFRDNHLINILESFDACTLPLDVFLNKYFRSHKAIGSKDRSYICEYLYQLIRWKDLIDANCKTNHSWPERLEALKKEPIETMIQNLNLPAYTRVSFPKSFYEHLADSLGEEKAISFCLNSNETAPITIRVNKLRCSRDELFEKWKESFTLEKCKISPDGITFKKRSNFFQLPEFKEGLFEVQDEGSQIVASFVDAKPGDHVLDFCAGSGGKTLAFAPSLNKQGQIYLYDIRPFALQEAKKRLKRAGIQNAQILDVEKLKKRGMQGRMDWILLDVPCSGSGTLRRNPDMKWRFSPQMLASVVQEQRLIFEKALKHLKKEGRIVYATCSVFPDENQNQIEYFIKTYDLILEKPMFQSFPEKDSMDGFFCAVLKRKEN